MEELNPKKKSSTLLPTYRPAMMHLDQHSDACWGGEQNSKEARLGTEAVSGPRPPGMVKPSCLGVLVVSTFGAAVAGSRSATAAAFTWEADRDAQMCLPAVSIHID
jgi:hypothetical protein